MKPYKERVLEKYKAHRAMNMCAAQALRSAKYEARYEDHRKCPFDNRWGYDGEEIRDLRNGWKLVFKIQQDNDYRLPWEDCDGIGVIEESTSRPGPEYNDWILQSEPYWYRYYDWKATLPEAIRDGWDAPPYRTGSKREQAMRAMRRTYEHLAGWFDDNWWYVGIIVELQDENDNVIDEDSCWGYESSDMTYIISEARSWAAHMLVRHMPRYWQRLKQLELELET